ncbi:MAG TPA: SDR family NAD(P)-dependent oxidoreductase, partial [Pyrinomonadaceae bacterium]|nr:SDR family NAD(P)-dependent oxidoreductase [Pyrinomonadaceae bacterium]
MTSKAEFWKNKVAFITGASSGIGRALSLEIAGLGGRLGLAARRQDELESLQNEIFAKCSDAKIYSLDVSDENAVKAAVDNLVETYGKIDIIIANAGISGNDELTRKGDPAGVRRVIETNFMGAVNTASAAIPYMLRQKRGHLVAISSLAAYRGLLRSGSYCASKAAMTKYFESLRLDLSHKGIKVTIIHPGFIKTPLTAGRQNKMPFLMELEDSIPLFLKAIEKQKPFAAFPFPLAMLVRLGLIMPAFLYDKIAGSLRYRE